ncbi:MAG: hypothetical protein ACXWKP_25895 [Bradyrhizobium sp.]
MATPQSRMPPSGTSDEEVAAYGEVPSLLLAMWQFWLRPPRLSSGYSQGPKRECRIFHIKSQPNNLILGGDFIFPEILHSD